MFSTFSYEIGAIFVLAGLLMYGSVSGIIPKALRIGKPAGVVLALGLAAFAIYHYAPEMNAALRSLIAPAVPAPSAPATAAAPKRASPPPRTAKKKTAEPEHWKTTIVDESIPAPIETKENAAQPPPRESAAEPPRTVSEDASASPYDSGVKRAAKSALRFLHLGRKKTTDP